VAKGGGGGSDGMGGAVGKKEFVVRTMVAKL
jgi:hypothetical protein